MDKKFSFEYDESFIVTEEYLTKLPDLQSGEIKGSPVDIEKVGISNFHLPLKIKRKDGSYNELECSIIGTVSLEAFKKGINMSRILRTFYEYKDSYFDIEKLTEVLDSYSKNLGSFDAYILCSFNYRIWQESLRSKNKNGDSNGGWQYYKVVFEVSYNSGKLEKVIHLDFPYSSACPCSSELSLHAMEQRNKYSIPHSQRSIAKVSIKFNKEIVWIEDIVEACRKALKTETLVFCKREDEQAFAELNGANTKFVEDAVRLLFEELNKDERITDFKVIASHNESLHSHDAIAVITKGVDGGFNDNFSFAELKSLVY